MIKPTAITLTAALLTGCATVHDPYTGQDRYELTDGGKIVVGLLVAGLAVGAAAALRDDGPDRTYKTSCSGNSCTTKVWD